MVVTGKYGEKLDPRRHAYRADLAAKRLEGRVKAPRFAEGHPYQVLTAKVPVRRDPHPDAALDTEALMGEKLMVYDKSEGWVWGQLERDGYVGYLPASSLSSNILTPTHRVSAVLALAYSTASALSAPVELLNFNALVSIISESGDFAELATGGFVGKRHLAGLDRFEPDYTATAERFIGLPYLFGGRSALGLDCSALVQNVMEAAGRSVPRDSDMQMEEIGPKILTGEDLRGLMRGDLVFWPGHVGIMADEVAIVHASATMMAVALEPVQDVAARSRKDGPVVSAVVRPQSP